MNAAVFETGLSWDNAAPIEGGVFIAVVGPSGAGKDTVIDYARERAGGFTASVHFLRRTVTRPASVGSEDHDTLEEADFARAEADGAFALSWRAHGLCYGLPADADRLVRTGMVVVANLSRRALPALQRRYAKVIVVNVTASREVLAERLAARGRETHEVIRARLARSKGGCCLCGDVREIVNDGAPQQAGDALKAIIAEAVAKASLGDVS